MYEYITYETDTLTAMYELSAIVPVTSFAVAIFANAIRWVHLIRVIISKDNSQFKTYCYFILLMLATAIMALTVGSMLVYGWSGWKRLDAAGAAG